MDIEAIRRDFPILQEKVHGKPLVYLDSGASSQKPQCVIDALVHYYQHDHSNVHRGGHELGTRATQAYEAARTRAAKFLNAAHPEEIIFTRGTTEGINLVASSLGVSYLKKGDLVILTEMEHHANLVPWHMLAERIGIRIAYIPLNIETGLLELSALPQLLDQKPRVVSLTHISNTLGAVNPVEEICRQAKSVGALSVIDAAQSGGHRPLDVQKIGCDFLALSGHKACGPTGIGLLYGRQELLDALPPYMGGGEMINTVTLEGSTYKNSPARFEAGTPNIADAIGLHTAFDYLDKLGRENIQKHDEDLGAYAYQRLSEMKGIRILGPKTGRAGVLSFAFSDAHAHDIATLADQYGIALRAGHHCNQPLMKKHGLTSTARASFYLYNTRSEIDFLAEVLPKIRKLLVG